MLKATALAGVDSDLWGTLGRAGSQRAGSPAWQTPVPKRALPVLGPWEPSAAETHEPGRAQGPKDTLPAPSEEPCAQREQLRLQHQLPTDAGCTPWHLAAEPRNLLSNPFSVFVHKSGKENPTR